MADDHTAYALAHASPGELAALAQSNPELRPAVALAPQAYPELLAWLAACGDPVVDAALTLRASGIGPDVLPLSLHALATQDRAHRPAVALAPQTYPGLLDWLAGRGDPAVDSALTVRPALLAALAAAAAAPVGAAATARGPVPVPTSAPAVEPTTAAPAPAVETTAAPAPVAAAVAPQVGEHAPPEDVIPDAAAREPAARKTVLPEAGPEPEAATPSEPPVPATTTRRHRRRWVLPTAIGTGAALVAAAIAIPLALAGGDDDTLTTEASSPALAPEEEAPSPSESPEEEAPSPTAPIGPVDGTPLWSITATDTPDLPENMRAFGFLVPSGNPDFHALGLNESPQQAGNVLLTGMQIGVPDSDVGGTRASAYDASTGELLWFTDLAPQGTCAVANDASSVLCGDAWWDLRSATPTLEDRYTLYDAATGTVLSETELGIEPQDIAPLEDGFAVVGPRDETTTVVTVLDSHGRPTSESVVVEEVPQFASVRANGDEILLLDRDGSGWAIDPSSPESWLKPWPGSRIEVETTAGRLTFDWTPSRALDNGEWALYGPDGQELWYTTDVIYPFPTPLKVDGTEYLLVRNEEGATVLGLDGTEAARWDRDITDARIVNGLPVLVDDDAQHVRAIDPLTGEDGWFATLVGTAVLTDMSVLDARADFNLSPTLTYFQPTLNGGGER